jgi:hypothetical protein
MVAKEVLTPSPNQSLNEPTLLIEIERLKQEIEEYRILDRHIKAENVELKEQHAEVSAKLNKVLQLVHYNRVIKKELKSEASSVNILQSEE